MRYELNRARMKGRMAELGLYQKDIAEIIKWSETTTVKKLSGEVDMKVGELCAFANAVGYEPSFFLTPVITENGMNGTK